MAWTVGVVFAILIGLKFGIKAGVVTFIAFVAGVAWRRAQAEPRGVAQFIRDDKGQPLSWTYDSKLFSLEVDFSTMQARIQAPQAKVDPDAAYPSSFKKYIEGPLDMTVPATCLGLTEVLETDVKTHRWSTPTVDYRAQGPVTVLVPGSYNEQYATGRTRLYFSTYHAKATLSPAEPGHVQRGTVAKSVSFPRALPAANAQYFAEAWGEARHHLESLVGFKVY